MKNQNPREFQVRESIVGNFFYHISHPDNLNKSLCGKEVMYSGISLDNWGISTNHIKEKFCETCKQLYDNRFNDENHNYIEPCDDCYYFQNKEICTPHRCTKNWYPEKPKRKGSFDGECSKFLHWCEAQVIEDGYAMVARRHGTLYSLEFFQRRNTIISKFIPEKLFCKVVQYMAYNRLFWRWLKW